MPETSSSNTEQMFPKMTLKYQELLYNYIITFFLEHTIWC